MSLSGRVKRQKGIVGRNYTATGFGYPFATRLQGICNIFAAV